MKIYTAFGSKKKLKEIKQLDIGLMLNSNWDNGLRALHLPYFAVDNGAFTSYLQNTQWNEEQFYNLLNDLKKNHLNPDFVVIPDVVANSHATLTLAYKHSWKLKYYNWPLYLALQDGMKEHEIEPHLPHIKGLFLGGTMEWKEKTLEKWIKFAHENNLKIHVGRFGTEKRILRAKMLGVDSIDSSNFMRHEKYRNAIIGTKHQEVLR